jgi:glycosyltransferase involved in cell wall biosynthesis
MKIALISEKFPPDHGGLAISAWRLAHLLLSAGHGVHVFAPSDKQATSNPNNFTAQKIHIYSLPVASRTDETLSTWFELIAAQHAKQQYDLLHAYFITQAGYIAVYLGRYLGIPSVVSARGNDLDRAIFEPRKAAHILYALQNANAVTANSSQLQRKAQALAPGRAIRLIPNGIDASYFCPQPHQSQLAAQLGLTKSPVIGFVGEARSKKGLAPLLLAFKDVANRQPILLWLLGGVRSGEDHELVKVFQKQNPGLPLLITDYISPQSLPPYYNLMDVLVIPSLRDGLPNALLEGMACERAVVASAVGGILDAIQDGENGLLVPPGDVAALVGAIQRLLTNDELRLHLGKNARARVMAEFTPERELSSNLDIYRQLLSIP